MGYNADAAVYVYAPEEEHNEAFAAWLAFNKESLFNHFTEAGLDKITERKPHGVLATERGDWGGDHVDDFMAYLRSLEAPDAPFIAWDMRVIGSEGGSEYLTSENSVYVLSSRIVFTIYGGDAS
jgi:hypothetical protein